MVGRVRVRVVQQLAIKICLYIYGDQDLGSSTHDLAFDV